VARFAALDNQHARALLSEFPGKTEADDAASDDDNVPSPHIGIVKEESLWTD
jgi:hypothetical protein